MILGPVSYIDCLVFCILLVPALLVNVGLFDTIHCIISTLPFLVFQLPYDFWKDRIRPEPHQRLPFVRYSSAFEDIVVRCVRYAFTNIDARIGRVFFSKQVALPFLRFRMFRRGYFIAPEYWKEHQYRSARGTWIIHDPVTPPDVVVYYIHGGGFMMGSTWFYLEFLFSWLHILRSSGYKNPAIFALEYTLVPDGVFPTQLVEALHGYEHVLSFARDPAKVVVSGDSAGAAIVLSLLLYLSQRTRKPDDISGIRIRPGLPGLAVLMSPWVRLLDEERKSTASDYLDAARLSEFGLQYGGVTPWQQQGERAWSTKDPLMSPGDCRDMSMWAAASPSYGFFVTYGGEEMFAPEIEAWVSELAEAGIAVESEREDGAIHAWPVAALFLANDTNRRLHGLASLTQAIRQRITPTP